MRRGGDEGEDRGGDGVKKKELRSWRCKRKKICKKKKYAGEI